MTGLKPLKDETTAPKTGGVNKVRLAKPDAHTSFPLCHVMSDSSISRRTEQAGAELRRWLFNSIHCDLSASQPTPMPTSLLHVSK